MRNDIIMTSKTACITILLLFITVLHGQNMSYCDSIDAIEDSVNAEWSNKIQYNNSSQFHASDYDIPVPIGGYAGIQRNLIYPEEALRLCIEGVVVLSVVVSKEGDSRCIHVLKSVRSDIDESAIDAMELTKWKPQMRDNIPIDRRINVPVVFKIDWKQKTRMKIANFMEHFKQ